MNMTNNIAKIRKALERADDFICGDVYRAQNDEALAALAELERAAAQPVAWMYDKGDEEGLVTPFNPLTTPGHGGRKNIRPLYAAPPAPVAEIREPTPEECGRIYSFWIGAEGCNGRTPGERMGRSMAIAYRAVMFPQKSEVGL